MAFNAKSLSYHTQEPAFLRRLRQEHLGSSPGTSRASITSHSKHPKQPAEDDQPIYVVEGDGEVVSKAEFDLMVSESGIETPNAVNSADTGKKSISGEGQVSQSATPPDATKSHTAAIGARTRKRQIKAVDESANVSCDQHPEKYSQTPIKAKRSKKMKLSFEDND